MSDLIKQLNDIGEWFDENNMLLSGGLIDDAIDHIKKLEQNEWIACSDRLPEKPHKSSYEHVDCYIYIDGKILERPWNCEHKVWDDEDYDDYFCDALTPSHWMIKKPITPPETKQ